MKEAERKNVTVLFADVCGFTELSRTTDPEQLTQFLARWFDRLVPLIEDYGGTVDKIIGDEIMALFGAPTAHEDDPDRALLAALAIRHEARGMTTVENPGPDLHVGINTGLVYAGPITADPHRSYSVVGEAVNVAARLADAAGPGQILVGLETVRRSPGFGFRPADSIVVDAHGGRFEAYELLGKRSGVLTETPHTAAADIPMVGRGSELQTLTRATKLLPGGTGAVVCVTGEAGLGKSRLLSEWRSSRMDPGMRAFQGTAARYGRDVSYGPFLDILQSISGMGAEDAKDERRQKLQERLWMLLGTEAEVATPHLTALMGLEASPDEAGCLAHMSPEARGRTLLRTMRRVFAGLAREAPTALLIEDLHGVDQSSLAMIRHLMPLARELPIVFVMSARPDAESPLSDFVDFLRSHHEDLLTEIRLAPLTREDSSQMLSMLAGDSGLPPGVKEAIDEKAEGNPLFLRETVKSLREGGWSAPRMKDDARDGIVPELSIPDSLKALVTARVDRLEDGPKRLLKTASVIGRTFSGRLLLDVFGDDETCGATVKDLCSAGLVNPPAEGCDGEYSFAHAVFQEVTYESILLEDRRRLHRRVADRIEGLHTDRLAEFSSILAYHYSRAEKWTDAQEYLIRAGDRAGEVAADTEALHHYRLALKACREAFGPDWDDTEQAALERKLGEALFRLGEHEAGLAHMRRALSLLDRPFPAGPAALRRATQAQLLRQTGHRSLPESLWNRRRKEPDSTADEAYKIYLELAWRDMFADPDRVLLVTLLGLNEAEKHGEIEGITRNLVYLGVVGLCVPSFRLAGMYLTKALRLAEETNRPDHLAPAFFGLTMYEHATGDIGSALEHCPQATQRFLDLGEMRWAAGALCASVDLLVLQGRLQEALSVSQKMEQIGEEVADMLILGWAYGDRAHILDLQGEDDGVEGLFSHSLELLESARDRLHILQFRANLAAFHLRRGRLSEARKILEAALALASAYPRLHWMRNTNLWLVRAELALAEAEARGNPRTDRDLEEAEHAVKEALRQRKWFRGAAVSAYRSQGTLEWLRGRDQEARTWWERSLQAGREMGAEYEAGLTELEAARRTRDRPSLERTASYFTDISAGLDARRARQALE